MNTVSRFALPAAALLSLAAPAFAQDLDAEIVRNPNDTVTYTVDLDGPPRGMSFLLTSTYPTFPFVRTPFGPLFLDPAAAIVVGQTPIDPLGHGRLQFTFPFPLVTGTRFYFQSFNIDAANHLALSGTYVSCLTQDFAFSSNPLPPNFGLVVKGYADSDDISARYRLIGQPGTRYRITVTDAQGNQVAQREVQVPATGNVTHLEFDRAAGLQRGHRWRLDEVSRGGVTERASGSFD